LRAVLLLAQWLLILSLPILLIATNINWAVNSLWLYEYGFNKYQISSATNLTPPELKKSAKQLIDYFNLRRASAQVIVLKEGKEVGLFTEREIIHLKDIKNLVQFSYRVQISLLVLMGVSILILWIGSRKRWWQGLAKSFLWGGVLTLGFVVTLAFGAIFAFGPLFYWWHVVSFPNEYWILDPEQHYLIRMFPEGFFQDATLFIFGATLIEALLLGIMAFGSLKFFSRR